MGETALLTCYFNPQGYASRRRNFSLFKDHLGQLTEKLWVVECKFPFNDFELEMSPRTIQISSLDVLWQKERLLNLAVSQMPETITKIVWLDCDIIFENGDWLSDTEAQLDRYVVVQPFRNAVHLGPNELTSTSSGLVSFGAAFVDAPARSQRLAYVEHGHTGFAYGARRELFTQLGLYDAAISGFGDHLMAHAFSASLQSPCLGHLLGLRESPFARHFLKWAEAAGHIVGGMLGVVPGRVFHLWHGAVENRRYYLRALQFQRFNFDPVQDVRIGSEGALEWASIKPDMHGWAANCFGWRREDGDGCP